MMQSGSRYVALVLAAALLGGCGLFGSRTDYSDSREGRPLEVPPDLDAPSTANALTIPQASASGTPATASPAPLTSELATSPPPVVAGDDATVAVSDSVAATWRRIGLALERSGVAEITARDDVAGTYTVAGTTSITRRAEGNFITRMFRSDSVESENVVRVVRVVADGAGSVVRVEDEQGTPVDDDLARRLIAAIKQRLG
jgi:uncharacterized lipoprotein